MMEKIIDKLTGQKVVCPWWLCYTFDNPLRRFFHNPDSMLSPYVHSGSRVIDIGVGMGFFTIPLARLVGVEGHVTAIDVQPEMLAALKRRAQGHDVLQRIKPYLCTPETLGKHEKADFILAFWMVHEVGDQRSFLQEIHELLKPEGLLLVAEPVFHVPKRIFKHTLQTVEEIGFEIKENPKIRFSHSALLALKKIDQ